MLEIVRDFFAVVANIAERIMFVWVWTTRKPLSPNDPKDLDYARSKYHPLYKSPRQLWHFFLFILIILLLLVATYMLAWAYFSIKY